MLCYDPLESELGVQSAWCPQSPDWGRLCPLRLPPAVRRLCIQVTEWILVSYKVHSASRPTTTVRYQGNALYSRTLIINGQLIFR